VNIYRQNSSLPPDIQGQIDNMELEFIMKDLPKAVDSMNIGANRISEIVLSLRNFSRTDEAELKPVNIHEGLDSTLLILGHRLKNADHPVIDIVKQYGTVPLVECYPAQLNQVFMNLLANSIKLSTLEKVASRYRSSRRYALRQARVLIAVVCI